MNKITAREYVIYCNDKFKEKFEEALHDTINEITEYNKLKQRQKELEILATTTGSTKEIEDEYKIIHNAIKALNKKEYERNKNVNQ